MAERIDPEVLFTLIASHVPEALHEHVLIVGSLAAAYHHRKQIEMGGVRTKDADVVIQPAGALDECKKIALRLLSDGWRRTDKCYPLAEPGPDLRAIRLSPPKTDVYFIELLALPALDEQEPKRWIPIELDDGWYGLPTFRFLGLTAHESLIAKGRLRYAAPRMMALANLLSHPRIGDERMSETIGDRALLRSAKDLGRALGLARLSPREELETWAASWEAALRAAFPKDWQSHVRRVGTGLDALLADPAVLDEARHALDIGLLSGMSVTAEQLRAVAAQLIADAIAPLVRAAG